MTAPDHPHAPAAGTMLCRLDELADGGVKGFAFGPPGKTFRMLVTRVGDAVHGYVDSCPHFQQPMQMPAGDFITVGTVLWCRWHYAQFRFEDGYCIEGPCKGGALDPVPVRIDDGRILIA